MQYLQPGARNEGRSLVYVPDFTSAYWFKQPSLKKTCGTPRRVQVRQHATCARNRAQWWRSTHYTNTHYYITPHEENDTKAIRHSWKLLLKSRHPAVCKCSSCRCSRTLVEDFARSQIQGPPAQKATKHKPSGHYEQALLMKAVVMAPLPLISISPRIWMLKSFSPGSCFSNSAVSSEHCTRPGRELLSMRLAVSK